MNRFHFFEWLALNLLLLSVCKEKWPFMSLDPPTHALMSASCDVKSCRCESILIRVHLTKGFAQFLWNVYQWLLSGFCWKLWHGLQRIRKRQKDDRIHAVSQPWMQFEKKNGVLSTNNGWEPFILYLKRTKSCMSIVSQVSYFIQSITCFIFVLWNPINPLLFSFFFFFFFFF